MRRKYSLTIDQREANALERVLSACSSKQMFVAECAPPPEPSPARGSAPSGDPLKLYDDNGNGRITCSEARKHGIAPVPRSHPAYRYMRDADSDGVVCE